MAPESNGEVTRYCCGGSNIAGARSFSITYMVLLGIIGIIMGGIWTSWTLPTIPFYAMSASFTFWFLLSILVNCGTNRRSYGLLMASFVLGIIGVLALLTYLFIYYSLHPEGLSVGEVTMFWVFISSCAKIALSIWYILVIFGAAKEVKNGINQGIAPEDNGGVNRYCCGGPTSNIGGAKIFAIITMVLTGVTLAFYKTFWYSPEYSTHLWFHYALLAFWFLLSILVICGASKRWFRLLMASFVLGIIGVLAVLSYLFLFVFFDPFQTKVPLAYSPYLMRYDPFTLYTMVIISCAAVASSSWYVLVIFGAMKEVKNGTNQGIIQHTPENTLLEQPMLMHTMGQPSEYIEAPTIEDPPPPYHSLALYQDQPSAPPLPQK